MSIYLLSFRVLGGLFLIYTVGSYIHAWYRLRHIKGPFLASFSYFWMLYISMKHNQSDSCGDLANKYGNLVRIGPSDVLTTDPSVIRRMNAARSRYGKSNWYKPLRFSSDYAFMFSLTDLGVHDRLKAQTSHGYAGKEVPTIEQDVSEQIQILVELIRRKYTSTKEFVPADLALLSQYFTLDAISKISFGEAFGYLKTERDTYGYMQTGDDIIFANSLAANVPWLGKILGISAVNNVVAPRSTDKQGMGVILGLAEDLVARRFAPDAKDEMDMLGSFKRHGLTAGECRAEIPFQILAGSDTTARAIRGTLLYLMSSPRDYRALQKEIDDGISQGIISNPAQACEGRNLPYLQGVIYEGLRLSLPATVLAMKEAPPEGDYIDDQFIPGGTRIGVAIKGVMRSTSIFGADAGLFRPERWLNLDPAQRRNMVDTAELIFGYGRFGCSGKPVALMELNMIFIELLRNFDFQIVNPQKPIEKSINAQTWVDKGMWVKITDRH
ncbi:hypothetical protein S40288_01777 [Stachybotrys chartarum IBT 40288]|nr:hypothetical protein S40288_01777 [Stachybotrys chartarum IBT 40288]